MQVFRHSHLLGTVVEILVDTPDRDMAGEVDRRAVEEIVRLESVFSAFDEQSELCRWRRGDDVDASPELCELMGHALDWQVRSAGAFNPASGELTAAWQLAAIDGEVPSSQMLRSLAASIREPRFELVGRTPIRVGDCSQLNVNAIAKGYIADRVVELVLEVAPVDGICVNAGGDLFHRGRTSVRVGIENPQRPYDNEPPLTAVAIRNQGLATSGASRRGVRIEGCWYGHVIDPRSGHAVDEIASISVVASDAMTADVLATVAGVEPPGDALALVQSLGGGACLVVDRHGGRWSNAAWEAIELS